MVRAFTVWIERVSIWFLLFSRIFYPHNLKLFKAVILECSTFLVHFYIVVFLFSSGNSIRESIVVSTSIHIEKFLLFFEVSFFLLDIYVAYYYVSQHLPAYYGKYIIHNVFRVNVLFWVLFDFVCLSFNGSKIFRILCTVPPQSQVAKLCFWFLKS